MVDWINGRSRTFATHGTFLSDTFFSRPVSQAAIITISLLVNRELHINSEHEILVIFSKYYSSFAGISKIRFSEHSPFVTQRLRNEVYSFRFPFNSSDVQTSTVRFYAPTKLAILILNGDLFIFKRVWRFLRLFHPFYNVYWWVCLEYLSYSVLILTCGFRLTPQENRFSIETCLLKTWNVSPLEAFFSNTYNTRLL